MRFRPTQLRAERVPAHAPAWQKAGVFYVRTAGMVRVFNLPIAGEFSGDTDESEYVLLHDGPLPVATCRPRGLDSTTAKIERVCVLPDYQGQGVGRVLIEAAEDWLRERGFTHIVIYSRDAVVGFYEGLGYVADWSRTEQDAWFRSVHTQKTL